MKYIRNMVLVDYFEVDLTKTNGVFELAQWALNNYNIDVLLNNAGIGGKVNFEDASTIYYENIIMFNINPC